MPLSALPTELLWSIADELCTRDIYYLGQANRRLYTSIDPYLYRRNIQWLNCSALRWAAFHGRTSTAQKLLDECHYPNTIAGYPWQILALASSRGHEGLVRAILDKGIDVVPQRGYQLSLAVRNGHKGVARLWITLGADPFDMGLGKACLHLAPLSKNLALVKFLVEEIGCDPYALNERDFTPLFYALQQHAWDIVLYLQEAMGIPWHMISLYAA